MAEIEDLKQSLEQVQNCTAAPANAHEAMAVVVHHPHAPAYFVWLSADMHELVKQSAEFVINKKLRALEKELAAL